MTTAALLPSPTVPPTPDPTATPSTNRDRSESTQSHHAPSDAAPGDSVSIRAAFEVDAASIDDVAWGIEREGLAPYEAWTQPVADLARRSGCSPVLAGVLADPAAPEVARIRAFGLLALQLG